MNAARASVPSQCSAPNFRPKRSKRTRFIPSLPYKDMALLLGKLSSDEVKALHWIADNGDLIIVADKAWLLTPAPKSLLDVLAAVGSIQADCEPDADNEDEHDDDGCVETDYGGASVPPFPDPYSPSPEASYHVR